MNKPIVAIVGKPNVGKSTFFNKVVGKRISIVEDIPGVTRDRIFADATWCGYAFTLVDTGGLDFTSKDEININILEQAQLAIDVADVIVFFVDGKEGMTAQDKEVATYLRKAKAPKILAVNKLDNNEVEKTYEFYDLGLGEPFGVSVEHGKGVGELLDAIIAKIKQIMELEELKQNWNIMEERLGRLEMDQRQQLNNKVVSKVKKVQDRVLRRFTIVVICLPFFCWYIVHNQMCDFSMLTWTLLFLFVAVILARQLTWMLLLRKIDCLKMTVREVCLAESRFRMSFKVGIAVSVLCAVPLLASLIWDMSQMGDHYLLIGVWTGLVVGMLIGIRLFLKAWSGIKELKEVITDLQ